MKKVIAMVLLAVVCLSVCSCGKKEKKQEVYFDAAACVGMTEDELKQSLGEADSVEDWVYNNSYYMRTYTYGTHEYIFAQEVGGNFALARISLYEDIPYTDKDTIYQLFNLKKTNVSDNGVTYSLNYVANGVSSVDVIDHTDSELKWVQITYISGLFEGKL